MTSPTPDPEHLDGLASASLDGIEPEEDELAGVDPDALRARRAELAQVREALEAPDPPPAVVDAAVAAALDAFDEGRETAAGSGPGAVARPIASRRRRAWYERIPVGAVAAVVVLVVMFGAVSWLADLDGTSDDVATSADSGGDAGDAAEESSADDADPAAEADVGDSAAEVDGSDDGVSGPFSAGYADTEELLVDLRSAFGDVGREENESTGSEFQGSDPGEEGCDAVRAGAVDPTAVVAVVPVVVGGDAVVAVVYDSAGGRRVAIVAPDGCELLDDRVL